MKKPSFLSASAYSPRRNSSDSGGSPRFSISAASNDGEYVVTNVNGAPGRHSVRMFASVSCSARATPARSDPHGNRTLTLSAAPRSSAGGDSIAATTNKTLPRPPFSGFFAALRAESTMFSAAASRPMKSVSGDCAALFKTFLPSPVPISRCTRENAALFFRKASASIGARAFPSKTIKRVSSVSFMAMDEILREYCIIDGVRGIPFFDRTRRKREKTRREINVF